MLLVAFQPTLIDEERIEAPLEYPMPQQSSLAATQQVINTHFPTHNK